jgi:hypothetical protein
MKLVPPRSLRILAQVHSDVLHERLLNVGGTVLTHFRMNADI